jgi:hypothetical protein
MSKNTTQIKAAVVAEKANLPAAKHQLWKARAETKY